jgi:hypothetical protein
LVVKAYQFCGSWCLEIGSVVIVNSVLMLDDEGCGIDVFGCKCLIYAGDYA